MTGSSPGDSAPATFGEIARRPDVVIPLVFIAIPAIGSFLIIPRVDFEATYREAFEGTTARMPAEKMVPAHSVR
jgi:hypothetical protein